MPTLRSGAYSSGPRHARRPPKAAPRSWTAPARICSEWSAVLVAPLPQPGRGRPAGRHHHRQRQVTAFLRAETGTDPATGRPTLAWWFDPVALDAEAASDGWYGLLTNLTCDQADAAEVLRRYKGREVVERR